MCTHQVRKETVCLTLVCGGVHRGLRWTCGKVHGKGWEIFTIFMHFWSVRAMSMVLFYAHCVINTNIYASVSGLNSGNFIQFGASVNLHCIYKYVFYLHCVLNTWLYIVWCYCDQSSIIYTVISTSRSFFYNAKLNVDCARCYSFMSMVFFICTFCR